MLVQPDPVKKLRLTKGAAAAVFQRIAAHASGLYHIAKNLVYKHIKEFAIGSCEEFFLQATDITRASTLHWTYINLRSLEKQNKNCIVYFQQIVHLEGQSTCTSRTQKKYT